MYGFCVVGVGVVVEDVLCECVVCGICVEVFVFEGVGDGFGYVGFVGICWFVDCDEFGGVGYVCFVGW